MYLWGLAGHGDARDAGEVGDLHPQPALAVVAALCARRIIIIIIIIITINNDTSLLLLLSLSSLLSISRGADFYLIVEMKQTTKVNSRGFLFRC